MGKQTKEERHQFYLRNKDRLSKAQAKYRKKHRKKYNASHKRYIMKRKAQVLALLPKICHLCGSKDDKKHRIVYHEIHGLKHCGKGNMGTNPNYILRNIKDFLPLDIRCHSTIHTLAEKLNIDINELWRLIELIRKGKP